MYDDKSKQGTTKYTGKIWDKQVAQADADQKKSMQVKHGIRELGDYLDTITGDASNSSKAGKTGPLPKRSK